MSASGRSGQPGTWTAGVQDGVASTLFYAIGERGPYEEALAAVSTMESYDITPVGDEAFYAFVRGRETDQSRKLTTAKVSKPGEHDARSRTFAIDLTARQREAAAAGRQVGYYDMPRIGSVEDVAEELSCATSTASNHFRKAEAQLVERVFR